MNKGYPYTFQGISLKNIPTNFKEYPKGISLENLRDIPCLNRKAYKALVLAGWLYSYSWVRRAIKKPLFPMPVQPRGGLL